MPFPSDVGDARRLLEPVHAGEHFWAGVFERVGDNADDARAVDTADSWLIVAFATEDFGPIGGCFEWAVCVVCAGPDDEVGEFWVGSVLRHFRSHAFVLRFFSHQIVDGDFAE